MRWLLILGLCPPALAEEGAAREWAEPVTGMPFVRIAKGCLEMGTSSAPFKLTNQDLAGVGYAPAFWRDEMPRHRVCLSEYWIGKFEVRADEWARVMGVAPSSGIGAEPAAGVSWQQVVAFAERLTALSGGAAKYRLPTEAEWEMACLAGQAEQIQNASDWPSVVPFVAASEGRYGRAYLRPQPVGSRKANPWGLHDMRGNVWEWVIDAYSATGYGRHSLFDPVERNDSGTAVIRGGSHRSELMDYRCANRGSYRQDDSLPAIGFRLVRVVKR